MIGGGVANGYDPAIKKDGTLLDRGLYRPAGREPARRVPQRRAAEPLGLHGSEGCRLIVLRPSRRQALRLLRRYFFFSSVILPEIGGASGPLVESSPTSFSPSSFSLSTIALSPWTIASM